MEYGYTNDNGAIKCSVCGKRIDLNKRLYRQNCCKSAYKQYLKSIGYWKEKK